jgi:hypothetical protein
MATQVCCYCCGLSLCTHSPLTIGHQSELCPVPTVFDRLCRGLDRRQPKQRFTIAGESDWIRLHAVLLDESAIPSVLDCLSLYRGLDASHDTANFIRRSTQRSVRWS